LLAERPRDMPVQRLRRRPDSQAPAVPLGAPPRVGSGER
jgi:hypothetical protein